MREISDFEASMGVTAFLVLWSLVLSLIVRYATIYDMAHLLRGDLPEWVVINRSRWRR